MLQSLLRSVTRRAGSAEIAEVHCKMARCGATCGLGAAQCENASLLTSHRQRPSRRAN